MWQCKCGAIFQAEGYPDELEAAHEAWESEHVCAERDASKTFWLSFCDSKLPKGSQFLGACVIDVTAAEAEDALIEVMLRFPLAQEGAEWMAAATRKAHALKCNPGGDVASMEIPADHPMLAKYQRGVLMDRATIERIDEEIERAAHNKTAS
jgi:hypothetical protein